MRQEIRRGREMYTELAPFTRFYPGEDYHQKYYLKSTLWVIEEYQAIYPDPDDFVNSTAVARVNGFAGGEGTAESLKRLLPVLGLSERANKKLKDIVGYNDNPEACPSGVEADS